MDDGFLSVCSKIIGQMIAEEVLIYAFADVFILIDSRQRVMVFVDFDIS